MPSRKPPPSAVAAVVPVTLRAPAAAQAGAGAEIPVAAPRGCTNLKLRQLTRRVSQHYDQVMAGVGLKTTQYSLLGHVERLGPVRPGDLAVAMEMDASTLTRNLQPLQAVGWIAVGPGEDGRSRLVHITDAGRLKRSQAQSSWKRAQLALNQRLGTARVAALHGLIDECLVLMNAPGENNDENNDNSNHHGDGAESPTPSGVSNA